MITAKRKHVLNKWAYRREGFGFSDPISATAKRSTKKEIARREALAPRTAEEKQYAKDWHQRYTDRKYFEKDCALADVQSEGIERKELQHRRAVKGGRATARLGHSDEQITNILRLYHKNNPELTMMTALENVINHQKNGKAQLIYSDKEKLLRRVTRMAKPKRPSDWYYSL